MIIMGRSLIFIDARNTIWTSRTRDFQLGSYKVQTFHFLADCIYPSCFFVALSIAGSRMKMEEAYCGHHSSARKAIEGIFGALFK